MLKTHLISIMMSILAQTNCSLYYPEITHSTYECLPQWRHHLSLRPTPPAPQTETNSKPSGQRKLNIWWPKNCFCGIFLEKRLSSFGQKSQDSEVRFGSEKFYLKSPKSLHTSGEKHGYRNLLFPFRFFCRKAFDSRFNSFCH